MKQYKYYLFDIDRTLWDFDSNSKRVIFSLLEFYNLVPKMGLPSKELFFKEYEAVNNDLWRKYELGKISKEELRVERFYATFAKYCLNGSTVEPQFKEPQLLREFSAGFSNEYLSRMPYQTDLIPGALTVLQTLKERGCKIATVSNGFKEIQYGKLSNSGILDYFDSIIISEEVGAHKPSPTIFKAALIALCGAQAYADPVKRRAIKRETIMVGDDVANDIEGAQIFGIDQFYYNPHNFLTDSGATYSSPDLLDILG